MTSKKMQILSAVFCLSAALIFGFAFVVVKNSLDTLPAGYMIAIRCTLAAIMLAAIFFKKFKSMTKMTLLYGFLLGASLCAGYILQAIGLNYTSAGKSAFLTSIYIILTPFLAFFMQKKHLDLYTIVAAALGFAGIGLICLGTVSGFNVGDIMTILSGVGFALQIVLMDMYLRKQDAILLTVFMFIFVALIAWIVAPILHGPITSAMINGDNIIALCYLGLGSSALAFLLQSTAQKHLSSSSTALFLAFEAVFGAMFGIIFLKEIFTTKMIIGCTMIFIATIISETKLTFIRRLLLNRKPHVYDSGEDKTDNIDTSNEENNA